jgi:hypothetical protein
VTNRSFDPLEKNREGWRWYAEDVKVPLIWDLTSKAGYTSAVINWPATVGAHATYLVPEFWRARTADYSKLLSISHGRQRGLHRLSRCSKKGHNPGV